jgi:hypothetical protein
MKTLTAAALIALSFNANANFLTNDRFLAMSEVQQLGIATAVADMVEHTNNQGKQCIPGGVMSGQLRLIAVAAIEKETANVRSWTSAHPLFSIKEEMLSQPLITIRDAFAQHFGCKIVKADGWVLVK